MKRYSLPPGFIANLRYGFGGVVRANYHIKGYRQDANQFADFEEGVLKGVEQDAGLLVFEGIPMGSTDYCVFYVCSEDCHNVTVLDSLAA